MTSWMPLNKAKNLSQPPLELRSFPYQGTPKGEEKEKNLAKIDANYRVYINELLFALLMKKWLIMMWKI